MMARQQHTGQSRHQARCPQWMPIIFLHLSLVTVSTSRVTGHYSALTKYLYEINWCKMKYTIRSIVCEASCHLVIQSNVHLVNRSSCHLVSRLSGHPVIQSSGYPIYLIILSSWHLVICSFGHLVIRSSHYNVILTCPRTDWLTDWHTTLGSTGLLRR